MRSQEHVTDAAPLGASLVADGATFRLWAPAARGVWLIVGATALRESRLPGWAPREDDALLRRGDGTWAGFVADVRDGDPYRFWVEGEGGSGFKRDPYARELGTSPPFPDCDCLVRAPHSYPWHDGGFVPPEPQDLVIYQLHVGTWHALDASGADARRARPGTFLDLLFRIDYLRELGVNAVQLLPIQEFPSEFSMGYNGTDYFSPETDYQVEDPGELTRYLAEANRRLARHGQPPLRPQELHPGPNQLKCVIDLLHLEGIAVLLDLVYNHAGGGFDDQSLYFLDRRRFTSNADSLYFTDRGWAGGLVFAYEKPEVRRFLVDNAAFFLREYHVDGFRYDEVSVIDDHGGWFFVQELTEAVRAADRAALQVAEYWNDWRWLAVLPAPSGLGCDAAMSDGLREALREALGQASFGAAAPVDLHAVAGALGPPPRFPAAWRAVNAVEDHDLVYHDRPPERRHPRIPALADGSDARSWWARSRARVATGILLTAPGTPFLFMGQEILEHRNWSDNPRFAPDTLIGWDELGRDRARRDHLEFTRDVVHLRRRLPALTRGKVRAYHVSDENRILAFHRWLEGTGDDVIVIASLCDRTWPRYALGFPWPGRWIEVFNSDYYDHLPNPVVTGNGGSVHAAGSGMHGFSFSAEPTLPANALLVFVRA